MPVSNPIRIAFCHYTADVGGGSDRSLFDLVTRLPRDGFESCMILKRGDPLASGYRAAGIEVVEVPLAHPRAAFEVKKLARFFLSFWPSVFYIVREIRRFRADIVHVNTRNNLQGAFAARLCGRPLVWHIRELGDAGIAVGLMLRLVGLLATRAVANSTAVGQTLRSCGDRVRVISNGIDLGRFKDTGDAPGIRRELGIGEDAPVAAVIGRLEPWKGQHALIEAVPRVLEKVPGAHFVIVGAPAVNKPEYAPALESRARALGVEGHVSFTGPREDVPQVLAASDLLVLPSVSPEPFGRTVVEAMAAGLPVVATQAGGPLDTVVDGETGWLVPLADPEAMADRIASVLRDPEGARAMGQRGRERAEALFSIERLVGDMAALFQEAGGGR